MSSKKHIPQRTCVACRTTGDKRKLVRAVRTPEGSIEVDPSGKRDGRGAYLCARQACWEEALKKGRLAASLRTTLSTHDRDALRQYASRLASQLEIPAVVGS